MSKETTFQDIQNVRLRTRQNSTVAVVTGDIIEASEKSEQETEENTEE